MRYLEASARSFVKSCFVIMNRLRFAGTSRFENFLSPSVLTLGIDVVIDIGEEVVVDVEEEVVVDVFAGGGTTTLRSILTFLHGVRKSSSLSSHQRSDCRG